MAWKKTLKRIFSVLSGQFIYGVLIKSLRGSLLMFGGALLLSGTSAWKFMESSFSAHDLVREAAWTKDIGSDVLVIGIDDTAYASYFDGTSPLRRDRLQMLLNTVQMSAPLVKRIVVDLDLAPAPNIDQSGLAAFLGERPGLWVIADPLRGAADDTSEARTWRDELCKKGVLLGRPYLPTDFGYVNSRDQFADSLSRVAVSGTSECGRAESAPMPGVSQDEKLALKRIPASMSPIYVKAGFVLPFHGNLDELAMWVKTINPRYVVLGGMWGTGDLLSTPFGNRYGAQLHGAAIDGALKGYRAIPYAFNFLVMWVSVGLMTIWLSSLKDWLEHHMGRHINDLPGHQFLMQKVWPIVALTLIFAMLIALADVLALVFSRTGLQTNTAVSAGSVLAYMILLWNFGLSKISRQESGQATWTKVLVNPVQADLTSLRLSLRRLIQRPMIANDQTAIHRYLSRRRAAFEAVMALSSLGLQTFLPMFIMVQSIHKSF